MGNLVEKKGFWITLLVLVALLIAGLIFSIVMIVKYGEPGEPKEEDQKKQEKTVGVQPNNGFLTFCNDNNLYALDANLASNPVVNVHVVKGESSSDITDAAQISAIWDSLKNMKIADASAEGVTPAEYIVTLHRNMGSDVTLTFQSPVLLTFNGANYNISDAAGFFDKIQ